jgi:hypothetical protein
MPFACVQATSAFVASYYPEWEAFVYRELKLIEFDERLH